MSPESRKTAVLVCAAGGLVVAALLLQKTPASGGAVGTRPTAGPEERPRPTPVDCSAPEGAAGRITASLSRGRATGALSAGKILRGGGGEVFASLDLVTDSSPIAGPRPALNIALVVDRSGSMESEGKLARAQEAALGLIDRLGAGDRIALVQYDDTAQVVVPSVAADEAGKARLRSAVSELRPGGSTNLHGGMTLGRDEVLRTLSAGQVSRVILLSDGLANAGESSPSVITDAARMAADRGVRITAVGVGLQYNEDLMEAIAESGRGGYYYVRDAAGLAAVLSGELAAAQATALAQVELRLRPACAGVEIGQVFGYETRREGDAVVVPLADLAGGDSRRLVVQIRVPDRNAGMRGAISAELRYVDRATGEAGRAELALALEVTDDHHAAMKSVDAEVMAHVLKAQAAETLRTAARAYEKGDAAGAAALLRESRARMAEEGGRLGVPAAALAPAFDGMDQFAAEAEANKPGSVEGKAMLKKRKSDARQLSKGK